MHVRNLVGVLMMIAMIGRPPQYSFLGRRLGQECHQKLVQAVELVGAMREVTVISRSHSEDADRIRGKAKRYQRPAKWHEEYPDDGQMHQREWNNRVRMLPQSGRKWFCLCHCCLLKNWLLRLLALQLR